MIDEQEMRKRYEAVANGIATVRLEGLSVDPVTTEDLYRHARGEIELDEVLRHLRERVAAGALHDLPAAP
jgi:Antitoxin VbhA